MLTHGRIEKLTRDRIKGRHADGKGLMLNVKPSGSASWVVRLMSNGRRRDYGLGGYPDVSLSMARFEAAKLAEKVKAGRDPVAEKRRPAAAPTLREALTATLAVKAPSWRGGGTAYAWRASLENHAPRLLPMPVDGITKADVLATLAKLADRPTTARYVRQRLRRCFAWAEASGHITANPCGDAIAAALPATPRDAGHYRALHHAEVGDALARVDATAASLSARLCLRFLTLTATRSKEARGARWSEIDAESATWSIPAERMKAKRPHRVALSRAALAVLEQARGLGDGPMVFPSPQGRGGVIDSQTLRNVLAGAGVKATAHGMRSAFRSWCAETGQRFDAAEAALAHAVGSAVVQAYQRSDLLEARRALMEAWGEYVTG